MLIKTYSIPDTEMPADTLLKPYRDTSETASQPTDLVFFDIETTGFSAATSQVYLIGCICFNGTCFQMIQWFCESCNDEAEAIHSFFQFIAAYRTLVHYNGEGFDMPFLLHRCRHYQLPYDFTRYESIDLYKLSVPYKNILKLPNLKQKTLETFLGREREDTLQGRELISIYHEYIHSPSASLQQQLLLHNYDDLIGMILLFPMISYYNLFHGNIQNVSCRLHTYQSARGIPMEEAIFSFSCLTPLPREISYRKEQFYLTGTSQKQTLSVQVYTDELKYFFPNYKDYYYLPLEDISIHKSVAFYVDKNFRTQAAAANCYHKKSGRFLPQKSEVIAPYFKQNYKDKHTYFELTEEFQQDEEKQLLYVQHILSCLV